MIATFLFFALLQTSGQNESHSEALAAQRDQFEATLLVSPYDVQAQDGEMRVSEQFALAERASGDFKTALSDLMRALKFLPENTRLLYDVGVLEEQISLYRDAYDTTEHLSKLEPEESKVTYLRARIELDLGRLGPAEADMRSYLQAHPEDASAHFGLGRILEQGQQQLAAKEEFEKAINLKPLQTESYYQLGQIALASNDFEEAIRQDTKVVARDPKHGGALTAIGIAFFRMKQFPRAETSLRNAVEVAPEYQLGHYYYGLVLARLGKKTQADAELALAAKMAEETNRKEAQRLQINPQ